MEFWKKPLWRVPLVLAGTGIVCRILSFLMAFIWGRIQIAQGPDPVTGVYHLTTGYVSILSAILAFILFWLAGWRFVRGMERRHIFYSATIMVVWHAILLAWEQISQAIGGYSLWVYFTSLPPRKLLPGPPSCYSASLIRCLGRWLFRSCLRRISTFCLENPKPLPDGSGFSLFL